MKRTPLAHLSMLPLLLAAQIAAAPAAHADETVSIVGVQSREAKLYSLPNTSSPVIGTWPANADFKDSPKPVKEIQDSFVKVEHEGKPAWVLIRYVRANRQIRMAETCGSMPTDNIPRSAATRGVGESCSKK